MPIEFFCQTCHSKLRTPDETAGKMVRCPKCGQLGRIPIDQHANSEEQTELEEDEDYEAGPAGASEFSPSGHPPKDFSYSQPPYGAPPPGGNPYSQPMADAQRARTYRMEPTGEQSRAAIVLPGIFMMVFGGIGALWGLMGVLALLGVLFGGNRGDELIGAIWLLTTGLFSLLAFFGGWAMVRQSNYSIAMIGTISMFISALTCCLLPVPIAIWSLVVLLNEENKRQFE
jgi:hypothetical protein